jgi:four helix bundle protein
MSGRRSAMAKGDDIQERLIDFAVQVMELCDALPKTFAGRHIGEQLFRAGTAGAANYAEARGSESKNDFIHKLGIVRKELNESLVWLRLVERRKLVPGDTLLKASMECDELCKIISASRKTAETNLRESKVGRANSEF